MIPRRHMPTYEIDGGLYVLDPDREKLWRFDGRTRNPRVVALADAAVHDGELDTVYVDGKTIELQHHMAGIERRLYAGEWLGEPVAVFSEVDGQQYAGDVAEAVTAGENGEVTA